MKEPFRKAFTERKENFGKERKMGKRGQATVIIILGLVLLIGMIGIAYISNSYLRGRMQEIVFGAEVVPEQIRPVRNYVESCVESLVEDGVRLMELQGGYIQIPPYPFSPTVRNPFTNALTSINSKTAYWFYVDYSDMGVDAVPTIGDMESELNDYVEKNLENCFGDFSEFREMEIVKTGRAEVNSEIVDYGVLVNLRYPLRIKYKGDIYGLRNYNAEFGTNYKKLYDIAREIIDAENRDLFLEELSVDIINLNYEGLPSVYFDFDIFCTPKIWRRSEMINNLKGILLNNIPLINVDKTNYVSYHPEFVWDVTRERHDDVFVSFVYSKNWPMYMEVFPGRGEIIKADPISQSSRFLTACVNYANFVYDVRYPVLVSIRDDNGEGFDFAFQVVVESNQPRSPRYSVSASIDVGYCDYKVNDVEILVEGISNDGNLEYLEGVDVYYNCINHGCYIGKTDIDGTLKEKFPLCVNGGLILRKEGYNEKRVQLTTFTGGRTPQLSIVMDSLYEMPYEIKVIENGVERDLGSDEVVAIGLIDVNDMIYGQKLFVSSDNQKVNLYSTKYKIEGNLYKNGVFNIRGKTVKKCEGPKIAGFCPWGEIEVDVPGIELEQVEVGGVNGEWEISRDELIGASKVIFYLEFDKVPVTVDDLKRKDYAEIVPELR